VTFDVYDSAIQIHDDSGVIKHMAAAAAAVTARTAGGPINNGGLSDSGVAMARDGGVP
jgi:hypothetical protein